MFSGLFSNTTEKEKDEAIKRIVEHATPRHDFFLMLMFSVAMATFGILLNSTVILIGSMLIAPMLYPILSFSVGIVVWDPKLILLSVYTILKSIVLTLITAFIISSAFLSYSIAALGGNIFPIELSGSEMFIYTFIAAISGLAAAFAITKPQLNETLPGVAISVSLVPPLATAGVMFAQFEWSSFINSLTLFFVNIVGVAFSAVIIFILLRFSVRKKAEKQAVKKEEAIIEKESE